MKSKNKQAAGLVVLLLAWSIIDFFNQVASTGFEEMTWLAKIFVPISWLALARLIYIFSKG